MYISVLSFQSYSAGKIKAEVGMTVSQGEIVKVSSKSIRIKPYDPELKDFDGDVKYTELSVPIWVLDSKYHDKIIRNKTQHVSPDVEQAIITIAQSLHEGDKIEVINLLAKTILDGKNMKNKSYSLTSNYGSVSEEVLATSIVKLTN